MNADDASGVGDVYRRMLNLSNFLEVKRHTEETSFIWHFKDGNRPREATLI